MIKITAEEIVANLSIGSTCSSSLFCGPFAPECIATCVANLEAVAGLVAIIDTANATIELSDCLLDCSPT